MRARSLARRWALTPPFHPYPFGRFVFCATFRGSLRAAVNGHPALWSPDFPLSYSESDRPTHSGMGILASRRHRCARVRRMQNPHLPRRSATRPLSCEITGEVRWARSGSASAHLTVACSTSDGSVVVADDYESGAETRTLGDVLYANRAGVRVSETDWVGARRIRRGSGSARAALTFRADESNRFYIAGANNRESRDR